MFLHVSRFWEQVNSRIINLSLRLSIEQTMDLYKEYENKKNEHQENKKKGDAHCIESFINGANNTTNN